MGQRGHRVHLYLPHEEFRKNRDFYRNMPFDVSPLPLQTYRLLKYAPRILRAFIYLQNTMRNYDVWQIVGAYPAGHVATSLSGRVPLVLRTYGDDIQKDPELNYGLRLDPRLERAIKRAVNAADRVVALTDTVTRCYIDLDVSREKIVEIPNGVDVARFRKPADTASIRQRWGIPADRPLVLTVGRNHRKKGFSIIPQVMSMARSLGASFYWLVVGKDTDELVPEIQRLGLGDSVGTVDEIDVVGGSDGRLEMPSDELIGLYKSADIFAFPSLLETFGRVIIEAMAAGVPVVTTDAPGCKDVVPDGRVGMIAKAGDASEFANHLYKLTRDAGLRRRLTQAGYRHVEKYDWDNITTSYELVYQELAA